MELDNNQLNGERYVDFDYDDNDNENNNNDERHNDVC